MLAVRRRVQRDGELALDLRVGADEGLRAPRAGGQHRDVAAGEGGHVGRVVHLDHVRRHDLVLARQRDHVLDGADRVRAVDQDRPDAGVAVEAQHLAVGTVVLHEVDAADGVGLAVHAEAVAAGPRVGQRLGGVGQLLPRSSAARRDPARPPRSGRSGSRGRRCRCRTAGRGCGPRCRCRPAARPE